MIGWIIAGVAFVVFILINETDLFHRKNINYIEISRFTTEEDIEILNNNRYAILLLHEFAGTPRSMESLGQYLQKMKIDVYIPALPGSVSNLEQYEQTIHPNFRLWWNFIRDKYLDLSVKYDKLIIIGASLGGSMALKLAENYPVDGIVTISSPVQIRGKHFRKKIQRNVMLAFSGILSLIVPQLETGVLSEEARNICPIYGIEGVLDTRAVHTQKVGLRDIRWKLGQVTAPVFSIHAMGDKTVSRQNQHIIVNRISSNFIRKKVYPLKKDTLTRHHRIVNHSFIKDNLYLEIGDFVNEIITGKGL